MKHYTGIGSRETPQTMCWFMHEVAFKFAQEGWILRSGGADGADKAFEEGCDEAGGDKEIYIPWNGFSGRNNSEQGVYLLGEGVEASARRIVHEIHPAPDKLTKGALALHARNCYQVAGLELKLPSRMLLCYAKTDKNGDALGGTRTAWMYAKQFAIKSFNLYIPEHYQRVKEWLNV